MKHHILIVDDNPNLRAKIARLLINDWEDMQVTEYAVESRIWPPEGANWSEYSAIMIDHMVNGNNIMPWLRAACDSLAMPPVIITSLMSDPQIAVDAIKAGASTFLHKEALTRARLHDSVARALKAHSPRKQKSTTLVADKRSALEQVDEQQLGVMAPELTENSLDQLTRPVASGNTRTSGLKARRQKNKERYRFSIGRKRWPEIDGYKVLDKIGQGGMSTIYLARRLYDDKHVVIKCLMANLAVNEKQMIRSDQEYRLISRIHNKHIVKLYDHGLIDDSMFTVMEYFPGSDLKQRIIKGITQSEVLQYLLQICSGLAAIHSYGIIHRDLKPANIMFRGDNTLAIIDFGISKDINSQLDLTIPGQVIGTPNYMAPEQGNSTYTSDARSDIYAVGVMVYEMLTGQKPYRASTNAGIIYKHLHDPIPTLPSEFFKMQSILSKTMAKFPHQRFQSALDMIAFIGKEFR